MEEMSDEYREAALRIGSLVLAWGRQESGEAALRPLDLYDAGDTEVFIDALGASSVPEACATITESIGS